LTVEPHDGGPRQPVAVFAVVADPDQSVDQLRTLICSSALMARDTVSGAQPAASAIADIRC
jgi:hypothetical protein